jgi:hypothetical protein
MRHRTWTIGLVGLLLATACGSEEASTNGADNAQSGPGVGGGGPATTSTGNGGDGAGGSPGGSGPGSGGGGAGSGGGPSGTLRILAIGDTGEGNAEQHCVADAMSAKCALVGGCDAVIMNGDNFYDNGVQGTDDPMWLTHFEQPYDRLDLNGLKFYVVLGNHDYGPTSSGDSQPQIDYSSLPVGMGPGFRYSDKWTMPAPFYDVVLGNGLFHIFALDSQSASPNPPISQQLPDMQGRVAASTATWKLAFAHHPRFTSGEHQGDNFLLDQVTQFTNPPGMFALFQGVYCNADIYMSGHDHDREVIAAGADRQCPDTTFVISGAGAKVRPSNFSQIPESLYYDESIEGFFYFEITPTQFVMESYDMDMADCAGAAMAAPAFSHTITK